MAHATYGAPYAGRYGGGLSTSVAALAAVRAGVRTVPGNGTPTPRFYPGKNAQIVNENRPGKDEQ